MVMGAFSCDVESHRPVRASSCIILYPVRHVFWDELRVYGCTFTMISVESGVVGRSLREA